MAEATDERGVLREHFERFRGVTLQTLDLVPADKLAWRPSQEQFSIARHFLHIAQTEDFYLHGFFGNDWNTDRFAAPQEDLSRADLRQRLDETHAFTLKCLEGLDALRLGEFVRVPGIPVAWSLRSWLWYVLEHEVHHKAQLALYLRQIGIVPPFFAFVLPPGVRPDIQSGSG